MSTASRLSRYAALCALMVLLVGFTLTGCKKQSQALAVGSPAPTIQLLDQNEELKSLQDFHGQPLVVYFYPKDNTPGCTTEACAFRDAWDRYTDAGVAIVGVSTDDSASHRAFAEEHNLPFTLLADTNSTLLHAFGLKARLGFAPRVSFLVDDNGTIRAVYPDVDPALHANEILDDAKALGLIEE